MPDLKLKKSIQKLPDSPGVYLFRRNKEVLYVGKAINLKKRVISYFNNVNPEIRIRNLLKEAKKIDFEKVDTELEALLLEAKLIKAYRPKYNVILKDDKRYLYLGISKHNYPRVFLLRQPEKTDDLKDYFGPFATAGSLREVFRLLRRIFPFRSCNKFPKKTCLYYELSLCLGICQYPNTKEYQKNIIKIRSFMNGRIKFLSLNLKKQMKSAAHNLDFEQAQILKNQILAVENILSKFKKIPEAEDKKKQLDWIRKILIKYQNIEPSLIHRLEAYDVANLGKKFVVGGMSVFTEGEPDNSAYRQFKIQAKSGGDPEGLKEIISRRLKNHDWLFPQVILIDGGKNQLSAAFTSLLEHNLQNQIALLGLVKGKETVIIPVYHQNLIVGWKSINKSNKSLGLPILQHARDEAHRFAQRYYRKLINKNLGLSG